MGRGAAAQAGVCKMSDGAYHDPAVDQAVAAIYAAARTADNELAQLHAIREGAEQLYRLGYDGAIDELSEYAIHRLQLNPNIVQGVLAQGVVNAQEAREKAKANGAGRAKAQTKQKEDSAPAVLTSLRASAYKMAAIQWLRPNRFAIGKLGLLVGLPDEGKGQVLSDIAARITRGSEWPCGEGTALQGNVVLLSAEDDAEDTVVPRLKAAGADLDKVEIVTMIRERDKERMFNLVSDLPLLRQKIAAVGNVRLVLIDPTSAYMGVGKIDSYRTADVRAVLAPVVALAAELKIAIIAVMHFNKKLDVTNALLRISDSLAFGATARHVFAVVDDPENKRKLFVRGKNNLARADIQSLAYEFSARCVGQDQQTGADIWAPHIVWQDEHVDVTASEAMAAATETKSPSARDDAKKFLEGLLLMGPMAKTEIEEAAEGHSIAWRTLERVKRELKVVCKKDGPNGTWTWRLPTAPWVGGG
jgi:putative DNA primase/helicase